MMRSTRVLAGGCAALVSACSAQAPPASENAGLPPATQASGPPAVSTSVASASGAADPATRTTPLVAGRPGRVFVFAGVGKNCEPLAPPEITIAQAPQKGDISFKAGQATTIAASAGGSCLGAKANGTGVYYTAREGSSGSDTFVLSARMATGETMTRTFTVTIAQ